MSVTVRPYRRGGWEVDITVRLPNGSRRRERCKVPVTSKSAAVRWGEDRERHLLQHGPPQRLKDVPTLEQFAPRFLDGHARANRQKPSGIQSKASVLRAHLMPMLGSKKLDAITTEQIQTVKRKLMHRAPKTVDNVLTVLNVLLKKAVEWMSWSGCRARSGCCPSRSPRRASTKRRVRGSRDGGESGRTERVPHCALGR